MQIRDINEADAPAFRAALAAVAAEGRFLATVEAPELASTTAFIRDNIARGNPHVVGLLANELIGWADIKAKQRTGFGHVGVLGMGLLYEQRGKGHGAALLAAALERAWAVGFEKVELDVYTDNQAAVALYRRFGFFDEGLRRRARKYHGAYQDLLLMGLFAPEN